MGIDLQYISLNDLLSVTKVWRYTQSGDLQCRWGRERDRDLQCVPVTGKGCGRIRESCQQREGCSGGETGQQGVWLPRDHSGAGRRATECHLESRDTSSRSGQAWSGL